MMRPHVARALLMLTLATSCVVVWPARTGAQGSIPTIALGRTESALVDSGLTGELRLELTRALGNYAGVVVTPRRRAKYVVDASVRSLDTQERNDELEVRCEVTLFISDAKSGAMHVILSGRGGVRRATETESGKRTALQAAIRSAVRPLGQTLRTLRL